MLLFHLLLLLLSYYHYHHRVKTTVSISQKSLTVNNLNIIIFL